MDGYKTKQLIDMKKKSVTHNSDGDYAWLNIANVDQPARDGMIYTKGCFRFTEEVPVRLLFGGEVVGKMTDMLLDGDKYLGKIFIDRSKLPADRVLYPAIGFALIESGANRVIKGKVIEVAIVPDPQDYIEPLKLV